MKREPPPYITAAGRIVYLSNKELMKAVLDSKEANKMTDTLAKMLQLLCFRYSKTGKYVNYSFNTDMQAYAMMMLVRTWNSFNPDKSNNPFAFFTQCIKHSFIQFLNQEKKQRMIRDELLLGQGLSPSFGYGEGSELDHTVLGIEDEQDFDANIVQANFLKRYAATHDEPILRDEIGEEIISVPVEEEEP